MRTILPPSGRKCEVIQQVVGKAHQHFRKKKYLISLSHVYIFYCYLKGVFFYLVFQECLTY